MMRRMGDIVLPAAVASRNKNLSLVSSSRRGSTPPSSRGRGFLLKDRLLHVVGQSRRTGSPKKKVLVAERYVGASSTVPTTAASSLLQKHPKREVGVSSKRGGRRRSSGLRSIRSSSGWRGLRTATSSGAGVSSSTVSTLLALTMAAKEVSGTALRRSSGDPLSRTVPSRRTTMWSASRIVRILWAITMSVVFLKASAVRRVA